MQNIENFKEENVEVATIPHLSEHFYKSRNSLLLFSGLLLAWELLGINLQEVDTIGGKFTIENTEAIPYVFLLLIFYFTFRLVIEWFQSNIERRLEKQSIIDFNISLIIPILAVLIYIVQKIFGISIFGKYQFWIFTFTSILVLLVVVFYGYKLVNLTKKKKEARKKLSSFSLDIKVLIHKLKANTNVGERDIAIQEISVLLDDKKQEIIESDYGETFQKYSLDVLYKLQNKAEFEYKIFMESQDDSEISIDERIQKGIP